MRRTIGTILRTGLENLHLREPRFFRYAEALEHLRGGEQVRLLHCRPQELRCRNDERESTRDW